QRDRSRPLDVQSALAAQQDQDLVALALADHQVRDPVAVPVAHHRRVAQQRLGGLPPPAPAHPPHPPRLPPHRPPPPPPPPTPARRGTRWDTSATWGRPSPWKSPTARKLQSPFSTSSVSDGRAGRWPSAWRRNTWP